MPGGRPSKYNEAYCEEVVNYMADGFSLTAFAGEIGVCRDTITEWCNVHPEFSLAVKRGKAKCAQWWENAARNSMSGGFAGKGAATITIFGLKNMAPDDWADKQQLEHGGANGGPIVTEIRRTIVKPEHSDG